jgi:REP element-mobilizing transposase RayT
MSQSLSSVLIHLIFSTKNREPFLTPLIEKELHPYMAKIFRSLKSPSLAINGTTDHIHALFSLSRVMKIADLVEEVKTETSKWLRRRVGNLKTSTGSEGMEHFLSASQSN